MQSSIRARVARTSRVLLAGKRTEASAACDAPKSAQTRHLWWTSQHRSKDAECVSDASCTNHRAGAAGARFPRPQLYCSFSSSTSGTNVGQASENTNSEEEQTNDPLENRDVITTSDEELPKAYQIPGAQSGGRKLALVFTCKVCNTRAIKQFTEHSYQKGVVIVRCPGCQNLHLIADRLGMFTDEGDWDIQKAIAKVGGEDKVKVVTDDNVLEFTLEDLVGTEKLEQAAVGLAAAEDKNDKSR